MSRFFLLRPSQNQIGLQFSVGQNTILRFNSSNLVSKKIFGCSKIEGCRQPLNPLGVTKQLGPACCPVVHWFAKAHQQHTVEASTAAITTATRRYTQRSNITMEAALDAPHMRTNPESWIDIVCLNNAILTGLMSSWKCIYITIVCHQSQHKFGMWFCLEAVSYFHCIMNNLLVNKCGISHRQWYACT